MKTTLLRNCAVLLLLGTVLAGCSTHCSCPTCPVAQSQQPPQTTIIHEPD